MADDRSSPRRPADSAFEESLRRRLRDTLDGVEGPDPIWASSPARREVEPVTRSFPVWRSVAAIAAVLLIVAVGLSALRLPLGSSSAASHPAASQAGAPSYAPSAATTAEATGEATTGTPAPSASGVPSATPTATLGPCPSPSGRTPDPLACLTCRCPSSSPSPAGAG